MELQKKYLIVCIKNTCRDFASVWKGLEERNLTNALYYDDRQETGGYGRLITNINKKLSELQRADMQRLEGDYGVCLWIEDCEENDIIEYQYLALMLQNFENVICYIYTKKEERKFTVYNNVSRFFSFFLEQDGRKERVWIQWQRKKETPTGTTTETTIEMLDTRLSNYGYRIVPIIEFLKESEKESNLASWTRTVGEFLEQCQYVGIIQGMETYQEILNSKARERQNLKRAQDDYRKTPTEQIHKREQIYSAKVREWKKKQIVLDDLCYKSRDDKLLCQCLNYFVGSVESKGKAQAEKFRALFWSKEIQDEIREIPLLAFYMMCMQLYFVEGKNKLDKADIKLLLVNSGELTEGVIQLIENIHHSSSRQGLLAIRIHKRSEDEGYLPTNYPDYYKRNGMYYNYEFRILDYSKQSIVESFCNRQKAHDIRNIGIRSFFEYVEEENFWKEYNQSQENLVHHYGLQVFAAIISNNNGYFRVTSSSKWKADKVEESYCNQGKHEKITDIHIPGTEYVVLLPMTRNTTPINPSVDADIQYQFDLKKRYCVCEFQNEKSYEQTDNWQYDRFAEQERKEAEINCLKGNILQWLEQKEKTQHGEIVALFSARDWAGRSTEKFCKALMLCLMEWSPLNGQKFYVIIKDCTSNDFISITRLFAIFYGKSGLRAHMDRLQVYLSGTDQSEEFLIAGSDLSRLLTLARKLTLVRGIQPQCMRSIEYILSKFSVKSDTENMAGQNMELVPFDMLQLPQSSETLFERAVKNVLDADLQKYSFGCKIKHTHMRIGSKLHIAEFYEAELLFHNNYYVSRFAILVMRHLEKKLNGAKQVMLVGYETYSELLLYEILTNMNEKEYDCSYMIYEQHRDAKFRYYDSPQYLREHENIVFVLIVPTNSSMTTHSKLRASLIQELDKTKKNFQIKRIINYALILIRSDKDGNPRDDLEDRYCESIEQGLVKSRYLPAGYNEINYFVCVNTQWHPPLECKLCFPKDSMLDEQPLIETNRASIIPMQMLGLQEPNLLEAEKDAEPYEGREQTDDLGENFRRVEHLGDSLVYRHIVRNGTHFMFYFELEKYFMQNREDIIEWLKSLQRQKEEANDIVYDIIVAPLHFSNAGFVAEVNYHLYGNAALVLNFEVEKEYRENVRTKYSNIIGLYKKLADMGSEAELRFHFVDDNIITANTYFRAKSLFTSLIPGSQNGNVKIKVFEDVIVILNRMSESSIRNCVSDRKDYHAYVSLNISSMRNHDDACTLCKTMENARILRDQSSTNELYEFWDRKMVRHETIPIEKYHLRQEDTEERHQRAIRRMMCTHIMNERLTKLGHLKNDTEQVRRVMLDLLEEHVDIDDAMEWIISYIKIFSRPFVCFRKSSREAVFQIMLELLEFMGNELVNTKAKLDKSRFSGYKELKGICNTIRDAKTKWQQEDKIYALLLTLMQRLSALGSNYIIRKQNIKKIFTLAEKLNNLDGGGEEFKRRYLGIVKRIVCLSSDESKCVYLEYLLLFGEEYKDEVAEKEMMEQKLKKNMGLQCDEEFRHILFLENTRVLYDGIRDLSDETDRDVTERMLLELIDSKYYYENFKRILAYYHLTEKNGRTLVALIQLYRMLSDGLKQGQEREVESFYNNLLEYVETITGTKDAKLLFLYEMQESQEGQKHKVYKKQRGMEIGVEELEYNNSEFHFDTYAIYRTEKNTRLLLKFRNYVGQNYSAKDKNRMNDVYLELNFMPKITDMQIMIALKCMMVFRNLVVENMEKDFSNNLMQKWSAEQDFKKNMKLARASDHTDEDELQKSLEIISKGSAEWDNDAKDVQRALFYLVINSYIARINVQLLADALPEGENEPCRFEYVYKHQLRSLIKALHRIEEFRILDENGDERFSENVLSSRIRMCKEGRRNERLSIRRLSIIITELIHSAIKYSDNQDVYIFREGAYFVVRNSFQNDNDIETIQQEAHDAYLRKRDGISLAVIKELVDKFYLLNGENGAIIDAEELDGRKFYFVKLPILENGERDEKNG